MQTPAPRLEKVSVLLYFAAVFAASTTTCFRSSTKARICCRRDSASGALKMDDGWTVAIVKGARSDATSFPCCRVTLNSFPNKDWAAVDPKQTKIRGRTMESSAASQGRHAWISE